MYFVREGQFVYTTSPKEYRSFRQVVTPGTRCARSNSATCSVSGTLDTSAVNSTTGAQSLWPVEKGAWLSEPALWTKWVHCGWLVARTSTGSHCEILELQVSTFH